MIYEWKDNEYKRLSPEGGIEATQSIGTIAIWMLPKITIPHGWLLCDGSEFDKDKYPDLYELGGDNHTPNLTGEYLLQGTKYLAKLNKLDTTSGMPNISGTWGYAWQSTKVTGLKWGDGIFRGGDHGSRSYTPEGSDSHAGVTFDSRWTGISAYQDVDSTMAKTIEVFYIIKALDTQPIYKWIEDNIKIEL